MKMTITPITATTAMTTAPRTSAKWTPVKPRMAARLTSRSRSIVGYRRTLRQRHALILTLSPPRQTLTAFLITLSGAGRRGSTLDVPDEYMSPYFADCTDQADMSTVDQPIGTNGTLCRLRTVPYLG